MAYFDRFVSNTTAASGNQFWFSTQGEEKHTRVFYRIFAGGSFDYSLRFTNTVDSTFDFGTESHADLICGEWELNAASVAVMGAETFDFAHAEGEFFPLTFDGKRAKTVDPGEVFASDPLLLTAKAGDYLCLDLRVRGECIPCLREIVIPAFSEKDGVFTEDYAVPLAGMLGCDRPVSARIGFLGDSITEGIGAPKNSYRHWSARIADKLGENYSYWNLGLGFGRAADVAGDGAWLNKAKQTDLCTVCYGVNDIYKGYSAEQILENLKTTVRILQKNRVKVILFSVPPFDFRGERLERYIAVNQAIRESSHCGADAFFDFARVIGTGEFSENAPYGGHPNADGSERIAEAFVRSVNVAELIRQGK